MALVVSIIGWIAVTASIIAIGALLVHVLVPGAVGSWDDRVVRSFVEHRTSPLTEASWVGSGLAETLTVVTAGLVLSVVLLVKRAWALLGLVVISLVMEITVYLAVTAVVHRQRPFVQQLEVRRQGASFPSGHTAAAVVLYFLIAAVVTVYANERRSHGDVAWAAVVVVPIVVALSRIYRGCTTPPTRSRGSSMGAGCVAVALLAVRTAGAVAHPQSFAARIPEDVAVRLAGGEERELVELDDPFGRLEDGCALRLEPGPALCEVERRGGDARTRRRARRGESSG